MCAILFLIATTIMVILGGDFHAETPEATCTDQEGYETPCTEAQGD